MAYLAGCASQPPAPVVSLLHSTSHLDVLEYPSTVEDDSLGRLFHPKEKKLSPDILATDRQRMEQQIDAALKQAFAQAELPGLSAATFTPLSDMQGMAIGQPLDPAALSALQAKYPAAVYLRVQVTDYGQTPRSWKSAYVTFEVTTTLAIGALLYTRTVTRPLAVAYLAQEGVEEFGEGYAGFWLVNRLSRPVRIDADLVDGATGKVLWHDTETGLASWRWGNVWHMDDATRDSLLQTSSDKAMTGLVNELSGH